MDGNRETIPDTYRGAVLYEKMDEAVTFNQIILPTWASAPTSGQYRIRAVAESSWWKLGRNINEAAPILVEGTIASEDMGNAANKRTVIKLAQPLTISAGLLLGIAMIVDTGYMYMNLWNEDIITPATNPERHNWFQNYTENAWIDMDPNNLVTERAPTFKLLLEETITGGSGLNIFKIVDPDTEQTYRWNFAIREGKLGILLTEEVE